MSKKGNSEGVFTYATSGVDRKERKIASESISSILKKVSRTGSSVIKLPFGVLYASSDNNNWFDLQIEGVGTKVLLSELSGDYTTIGFDGVAMVVNDVIRSGAKPLLLSDAIHIRHSASKIVKELVSGVLGAAELSDALLVSGETGDVAEILHSPLKDNSMPFDLIVSCMGTATKEKIIDGCVAEGDSVIGIESSGLHSNGLSLARKILLREWGGEFEGSEKPRDLQRTILEEMLEPTRIYVRAVQRVLDEGKIKAAVHITGGGYSKFSKISEFQKSRNGRATGFKFTIGRPPTIFRLIQDLAKKQHRPISNEEMYLTFNMGYGFALIVGQDVADKIQDILGKFFTSRKIGEVTGVGGIAIENGTTERPLKIPNI